MTDSRHSALNIRGAASARRARHARPGDPRANRRGEEPCPPLRADRTPRPASMLPDPAVRTLEAARVWR